MPQELKRVHQDRARLARVHRLSEGLLAELLTLRVDRYRQMRENLGRLTVESASETPDGLEVRARAANGDLVTLAFLIEPAAPYRMRGMRVQVG